MFCKNEEGYLKLLNLRNGSSLRAFLWWMAYYIKRPEVSSDLYSPSTRPHFRLFQIQKLKKIKVTINATKEITAIKISTDLMLSSIIINSIFNHFLIISKPEKKDRKETVPIPNTINDGGLMVDKRANKSIATPTPISIRQ